MEIPTAKKFLLDKAAGTYNIETNMIAFAQLHVEAALKVASEEAYTDYDEETCNGEGVWVVKESIINSYPKTNIK